MLQLFRGIGKNKKGLTCPGCSGVKIDIGSASAERKENKLCKVSHSLKCEECGATGTIVESWD